MAAGIYKPDPPHGNREKEWRDRARRQTDDEPPLRQTQGKHLTVLKAGLESCPFPPFSYSTEKSTQEALPQVRSPCELSPTQASKARRLAEMGMEESQPGLLLPMRGPLNQSNRKPQASTGINKPPRLASCSLVAMNACMQMKRRNQYERAGR